MCGQGARAPVGGRGRLLVQRRVDDARLDLGRHARCASRTRSVSPQRLDAAVQKTPPPQRHLPPIELDFGGDVLVLPTLGSQKDQACSLLHPRFYPPALGQDAQLPLGLRIQFDLVGNSHRSSLLEHLSLHLQISSFNYGAPH